MELFARSPYWLATILLLAIVELVWRLRSGRGYDGRAALATFGIVAGNILFAAINGAIVGSAALAAASIAPVQWPLHDWRSWVAGFLLFELAYYWFHRTSHRMRWMWATHSVHHSAEQLTLLASMRLGWTNALSLGWLFYVPLLIAGCPPVMVAVLRAFDLRYQFFLHTEAIGRLGPLEWVLNTPSHHRVHHASNAAYRDRNYGGVLIVFDRLFGTFAQERPEDPPRYGLAGHAPTNNPLRIALGEFMHMIRDLRRTPGLRAQLRILTGPPGENARANASAQGG